MVFTDTIMYFGVFDTDTMSEYTSPVTMAFEFQRNAIEGTHEAVENGIQMQKNLNDAFVGNFDPARDVSGRGTDLVRTSIDTYLDALESAVPAGSGLSEIRTMMHDGVDTLEESQLEVIDQFEANVKESAESGEAFLDEFLAALDEQIETLLTNHEQLEEQTVAALEQLEEAVEELQDEFEARGEELQKQLESQAEAVQEQLEDVTESMHDATDVTDASA